MKKKEMPIRFAFYGRVSSDQQDIENIAGQISGIENSIAGQRSVAKDYAVPAGGFIVKEYIDEAKSGRVADRPGFQEMIKDGISPDPPFDAIIVWKLNRFARNVKDMIWYWDLLEEHGIKVISVMEPMLVGATGRLMRNVIASFDEFFSENMASDIKRGMKQAVERGYWIGYPAPLGYEAVKVLDGREDEENDNKQKTRRKLELDPPWDKLARHIWELALKDLSVLDIARKVTDEGYLTKAGKKFTKNKIHRILTNQAYTGFVVWNVDPKTGVPEARSKKQAHPAIVSKAEFDKVQQKLKSRAPNVQHPRTAANEHLFNDLGKCSLCGGKILIKSGKNGTYFYFTCKTRDDFGEKACDLPSYSIAKNDPIIMRAIIDHILAKENLRDLITIVRATAGPTMQDQERQIANIDLQIKSLNEREDRLIDAIEEGKNPRKKLDARIDKIEAAIKEQEAKRAEVLSLMGDEATILQDPDLIVAYAEDVRTYLQREHVKSVNAICRRFIKTIRFEPGFAEIEYTIPIPDGTTKPKAKKHKVALQTRVPRTVPDGPPLPAAATSRRGTLLPYDSGTHGRRISALFTHRRRIDRAAGCLGCAGRGEGKALSHIVGADIRHRHDGDIPDLIAAGDTWRQRVPIADCGVQFPPGFRRLPVCPQPPRSASVGGLVRRRNHGAHRPDHVGLRNRVGQSRQRTVGNDAHLRGDRGGAESG